MSKPPADPNNETKVIFQSQTAEIVHMIQSSELSESDLSEIEKKVKEIKERQEREALPITKMSQKAAI